jgi:xylulose-5-phosphate/fructose-6-phosphate phosphoketolase
MPDAEFDALFTTDRPWIFAYHGYPWLIHRLTYRRTNHGNIHVRGYKEEGTITTPFDMAVLNDLDRYHLAMDAIARLPHLGARGDAARRDLADTLAIHHDYIRRHGEDLPEIREWRWPG